MNDPDLRPRRTVPCGHYRRRTPIVLLVAWLLSYSGSALASDWHQRYDEARQAMLNDRNDEAADMFDELERTAPTAGDRKVAEELARVAREKADLQRLQLHDPHIRTADELSLLYTTAFIYGFGTSSWLALQIQPKNVAAAVVPYLLITTASVASVAVADAHRPFRLGVPQAMTAGMFLGLGEGVWLTGIQHARATERDDGSHWKSPTASTLLWTGATVGLLGGAAAAGLFEPLPGQVSFASSGALWGGITSSFAGAALSSDTHRQRNAFVSGAVGYNVGLIAAAVLAPTANPSIARVRFLDLGGLAGGLVGAGGYLLGAGDAASPRLALGSAALGSLAGLGLSWWATADMKPGERHPEEDKEPTSTRLLPGISLVRGGWVATLGGSL